MKSNIYKFWLASSFSLCCLLAPKAATAQEIFLCGDKFSAHYQQITIKSVTEVTQSLDISFTNNVAEIGKTTNNPKHNLTITKGKNTEFNSSESEARTGVAAKGGKKPPRKG